MIEEFEDFKLFKISELNPEDVIIINTSTLVSTETALACQKKLNELFPNNKWICFNTDGDFEVRVDNESIERNRKKEKDAEWAKNWETFLRCYR